MSSDIDQAGPGEKVGGITMPTQADLQRLSKDQRLAQAAEASQSASYVQSIVDQLRSKAALITNPEERKRVLTDAFNREIEARGLTRKAQILQSGTFQGAVAGAGLGAATAAGLGTAVGTLVGTVAGVATTPVGGLVGTGVGAFHGPWIRLGGKGNEKAAKDESTVQDSSEIVSATVEEKLAVEHTVQTSEQKDVAKKKPKKLEIRSKQADTTTTPGEVKRKPPKIEVRSSKAKPAQ